LSQFEDLRKHRLRDPRLGHPSVARGRHSPDHLLRVATTLLGLPLCLALRRRHLVSQLRLLPTDTNVQLVALSPPRLPPKKGSPSLARAASKLRRWLQDRTRRRSYAQQRWRQRLQRTKPSLRRVPSGFNHGQHHDTLDKFPVLAYDFLLDILPSGPAVIRKMPAWLRIRCVLCA
jgi:hypothetical protein